MSHGITTEEFARVMAKVYEPDLDWDKRGEYDLLDRETLTGSAQQILDRLSWAGFSVERFDDLALDEFDPPTSLADWEYTLGPDINGVRHRRRSGGAWEPIPEPGDPSPIRCDYCGDDLPSVKHRSHIPTTPSLQRLGFAADKIVCPECAAKARSAERRSADG